MSPRGHPRRLCVFKPVTTQACRLWRNAFIFCTIKEDCSFMMASLGPFPWGLIPWLKQRKCRCVPFWNQHNHFQKMDLNMNFAPKLTQYQDRVDISLKKFLKLKIFLFLEHSFLSSLGWKISKLKGEEDVEIETVQTFKLSWNIDKYSLRFLTMNFVKIMMNQEIIGVLLLL